MNARCFAAGCAAFLMAAMVHAQSVPPTPAVEGPITGPEPMHPGMRQGPEGTNLLADLDYVVDEYFVSGTTGATATPYKVRMVIWRPAKPKKFSGVVVYEPTHQGGNALICQYARYGIAKRGHICITVSSQNVVLTSTTVNEINPRGIGLYMYNPERYGTAANPILQVANSQANEVLAQIGWMIRSNSPRSPLNADYPVERMVMGGTSASSNFVRTYMGSGLNDLPADGWIADGFFLTATLGSAPVAVNKRPTIQVPTQFEVAGTNAYRRPDSDDPLNSFRIYEIPGMSHNDSRDQPAAVFPGCHEPLSRFPYGPMTFMALQHLIDWVHGGKVPPRADYIEVNAGPPRALAFDELGNAKGGVRTPHLDVPIFRYIAPNTSVPNTLCNQSGREERFSDEVLRALYPTRGEYRHRFNHRLHELERAGWWPREYSKLYARDDAKLYAEEIPQPPKPPAKK